MRQLCRMFPYFGAKTKIAKRYPSPKYKTIIEPFAGSAGYSLRHSDHDVRLYDASEVVCGVWEFLIKSTPYEILSLPSKFIDIRTIEPQEARWLIGFWTKYGSDHSLNGPSRFVLNHFTDRKGNTSPTSFWGNQVKVRLANTVQYIKHWKIERRSYETLEDETATWFIDPPYQGDVGKNYLKNNNSRIDFKHLGDWCRGRSGQVIVCDQPTATYLPFQNIGEIICGTYNKDGSKKRTNEAVWVKDE